MSDEWIRFQQKIDEMKGYKKSRLRIAITSIAKYFVLRLLGSFCKAYPDIELSLEVLNRNGIVQRLGENADDLYIMSRPYKDIALKQYAFFDNPLVLIAPLSHRLANKRSQSLKVVEHDAFILREHGSGKRLPVMSILRNMFLVSIYEWKSVAARPSSKQWRADSV